MKALAKAGQSSQGSTEPWDTAFNRATNAFKQRDLDLPPTSAGRVSSFGLTMKVGEYYQSDAKSRKARRTSSKDKAEVEELKKKVQSLEQAKEDLPKLVEERVNQQLRACLPPNLLEGIAAWNARGQQGPIHVPTFTGSNSSRNQPPSPDLVTPQPNAGAQPHLQLDAPPSPTAADDRAAMLDNAPEQLENERPATRVSTLAELDALKVVTN